MLKRKGYTKKCILAAVTAMAVLLGGCGMIDRYLTVDGDGMERDNATVLDENKAERYAAIEKNYPTEHTPAPAPTPQPPAVEAPVASPSKEEVLADTKVEESRQSAFYFQPNVDKDLEDFMQNYGLDDSDLAEDDIDYSAYLSEVQNGGDAQ